jgi:hypothetical protein
MQALERTDMNPTYISKSMDGMMAKANDCFPIGPKVSSKRAWLEDKELYIGDISGVERVLTPVIIDTDMYKKVYLMDAITGTLFKIQGGKCLTSDQLHLKRFAKVNNLDQKLMKAKGDLSGGDE